MICEKYGSAIIEDAAEALGSSYKGEKLGSLGDFGIFSFNGNKIITTSGGVALVSQNKEWIEKARFLASQARDQGVHYEHSQIGFNYRMSNIVAGIGRGQLKVLNKWVKKRREVNQFYKELFKNEVGVSFLEEPSNDYFSNFWLSTLVIDPTQSKNLDREKLRLALLEDNIESRPLWKPMHLQPAFEEFPFYGNGFSKYLFENGLCLPSGSNLIENDLERIKRKILGILA